MENMDKQKKTNQPALIVLNVILLIGVVVLFYLYFSKPDREKPNSKNKAAIKEMVQKRTNAIAYVNSDVILEKYKLVQKLANQLEKDRKAKDAEFSQRQKEYEEEAAYFQESVQKQSISEESAQRIYEQLMMKQEELYQLQDRYANQLAQKEFEMNVILLDSVKNYLDRVNKTYQFDFILNYNTGGAILLAKDTFDITSSVLKGLNEEYTMKYPAKK